MFRSRLTNNILVSFLIANLLILIGKDDWLSLFLMPRQYLDMLVSFISVFIVFEYTDRISSFLNSKISWYSHPVKRGLVQFGLGVIIPAIMAIILTFIMWEFLWHKSLIDDDYFKYEFLPAVLLIITINFFFVIKFLFRNTPSKSESSPTIVGSKGSSKIPVSIEETACIILRNGVVSLITFSNDQIMLPQNMDYYEKNLPKESFFRANRQFIVSRQACKSFNSALNGKVEVQVLPATAKVVVSQKRAAGFRSWIRS